jgi:hypothetical protein
LGVKARILPKSGVPERYRRKEIAKVNFSRTHQKEMLLWPIKSQWQKGTLSMANKNETTTSNFYHDPSKGSGNK